MSSPPPFDPYEVLGVPRDADEQVVKKAHRKLVLKCHPDRCQDEALRAKAADMFHRVQRSYEILVDKVERTRYDNQIEWIKLRTEQFAIGLRNPGRSSPRVVEISQLEKKERRKDQVELRRPASSFVGGHEKRYKNRAPPRRTASSFVGGPVKKSSDDRLPGLRAPTVSHIQEMTNYGRISVQRASTSAYDNQRNTQGGHALPTRMRVDEGPDVPTQNTTVGIPNVPNLPGWYSCGTCNQTFTSASSLRSHPRGKLRCSSFGGTEDFSLENFVQNSRKNKSLPCSPQPPYHQNSQLRPNSGLHGSVSSLPLRQNKEEITKAGFSDQRKYSYQHQADRTTATDVSSALSDPAPSGFSSKRQRHTPGHSNTGYMIVEPDSNYENPSVVRHIQPKGSEKIESANKGDERLTKEGHKRANDRALSWLNPTPKPVTAFPNPLLPDVPLLEHRNGKRSRYLSSTLTAATGLRDQRIDREDNCAIDAQNLGTNPANNAFKALMGVQNVVVPALKPRKEQRIAADPAMPNYISSEELTRPARNVSTLESWDDLMKTAKLQRDLEGVNDREARESISSAISTHKIDATDAKSWTALHYATGNGIGSAVDWLLRKGADIHYPTDTGYEPLHVAIEREQQSTMRILLEHGANFNGKGRSKGVSDIITPIELAVSKNKEPLVRLLLQHAKKSTLINEQYALRWAAEYGDIDIVRLLLEHGADPNSSNDDDCGNALHGACKKGRAEVVQLLLEYKASTDAKAFYDHIVKYRTAMYIAQKEGHESVVARLRLMGVELSPEIRSADPEKPKRALCVWMQTVDELGQVPESAQSNDQATKTGLTKSQGPGTSMTAKARSTTIARKSRNVDKTRDHEGDKDYLLQKSEINSEADISTRRYSTDYRCQVSKAETIVHDSSPRQRTNLELKADIDADAACEMEFVGSESSRMSSSCLPIISKVQEATENNDPPSESTETSESSFSGSDHSDEDGCHIVSRKMQELIERIMTEFYSLFLPRWTQNGTGQVKCAHGSKSGQSCGHIHSTTASASASQVADSSAGKSLLKRAMNDRDWPPGDSEDEDRKRPKPLPAPRGEGVHARKFACPFFKFDPKVFSKYGSCTGPGFKSVSRVKEHLYRRHQPPIQCPRCWTDMQDNQELENHLRLTSQCELRSRPPFLGISPRKLELLKTKKRQSSDLGEEGKWRAVFRILFPGADIPCPYYEPPTRASDASPGSEELETFQEFARVQLPLLVEAKYESKIQQKLHPLEEEFKRGLGETVRTALTELFKTWQEKSPRATPPSSGAHSRTSSNRSTERTSSGFMSIGSKMDELPSVFPKQLPPEPLSSQFPPEQGLDNAYQNHRISDSGESDYSLLFYEPYPCICNSPLGMPSFPGLGDSLATDNSQTGYSGHGFTSMTGAVDMSFTQIQGIGHDEMLNHNEGKGKARQENMGDNSPRFCGICGGVL